ncbi:MAG: [LysW]-lysine hydrolase [Caldilineae bacterium]|nr:MAG: [LysW]-lysine hydrolase [Caldilineae bacterium]
MNANVSSLSHLEPLPSLLQIYSPSGREGEAVAFLVEWMRGAGFQAYVDAAGNAVGVLDGGPQPDGSPPREVVLLGHIDTVQGFIPVALRQGRLYGRGAVDAKGPLAAFAVAAARVGARPGWRIVVVGAVEEESATSKGARQAARDFHPTFAVIGEPSQWNRITLGYKGRLLLDYRYTRSLSHRAGPDIGACEHAVAYWNSVAAWSASFNEGRERLFDRLLPSLRRFHSHDDGFSEVAEMTLGFRLPPDLTPAVLEERLQELNRGAELRFYGGEQAYRCRRDTPLVRAFLAAIRAQGERPNFVLKTGTSDMNVVGPVWQCPLLAYGPGDSRLDHTPEEHVLAEEWRRGVDVLAHALSELTGSGL